MVNKMLDLLIDEKRKEYRCFDLLKELYTTNSEFKEAIDNGVRLGKIHGFSEDVWDLIESQNIRVINSFEDVFATGFNIGGCTTVTKQFSYSFDNILICGGDVRFLENTKNSDEKGKHTWMIKDNIIYDTSLMLIIDENYAHEYLGYKELKRDNPSKDRMYNNAREYARDKNLKK